MRADLPSRAHFETGEAVIGLEVHVQLATERKLFCPDRAAPDEPNRNVCPVCLGLPGALPVLNPAAVELALRAALGLGCTIHTDSRFERKSYFYPDLPKGYQITQHDRPLATGGRLEVATGPQDAVVALRRVHLEEDAGRLLHDAVAGRTAVDLNRAGVALIEIVTEPELHTPALARAFLVRLRQTLRYLAVSECDMENGSLRVDANVSVLRSDGRPAARVEIKNLNSFAHVESALRYEIRRQVSELRAGRAVRAETRSWDASSRITRVRRVKEDADDYRFTREPDLPPVIVTAELLEHVRSRLPELPAQRERRFAAAYDLPLYDVEVLTAHADLADYFEAVVRVCAEPREAARWVMGPVMAWLNVSGAAVQAMPLSPERLAGLIELVAAGRVSRGAARSLFDGMIADGASAAELLERSGLAQVSDEAQIRSWIDDVVARYPDEVARVRAGERKLIGFLMGRIMKRSEGTADPARTSRLLEEQLNA